MPKNWVFFGFSQVGYDILAYLLKTGEHVSCVVTHPHENEWFDNIEVLTSAYNIPVFYVKSAQDLKEFMPQLSCFPCDFLLSAYFRLLLNEEILALPKEAALNMHGSLLPKYRGRCPVNWAIMEGEMETGATLHHMVAKADAGDIVDAEKFPIEVTDTAGSVMKKMGKAALAIMERQLPFLRQGNVARTPQNLDEGFYRGGRSAKDSQIDWSKSARDIRNFVRALQPSSQYPCAFTPYEINGKVYKFNIISGNAFYFPWQHYPAGTLIGWARNRYPYFACDKSQYLLVTEFEIISPLRPR